MIKVKTVEPPNKAAVAASLKKALMKEIGAKWKIFSETELSSFSTKDEIVTQVARLYNIDKPQALRDLDEVLKGRRI